MNLETPLLSLRAVIFTLISTARSRHVWGEGGTGQGEGLEWGGTSGDLLGGVIHTGRGAKLSSTLGVPVATHPDLAMPTDASIPPGIATLT